MPHHLRRCLAALLTTVGFLATPFSAAAFDGVVLWRADARTPVVTASAGHADPVAGTGEVSATTPLHVGSITKLFTAVLVMQQVAEGRVALDAPIGRWLPALPKDAAGAVTVRQLLQHRSGLPDWQAEEDAAGDVVPAIPSAQLGERVLAAAGAPARAAPGGDFHYNNLDYLLLALVLERATGQPYPQLLSARILRPLKLRQTYLLTEPATGRNHRQPTAVPVPAATIRDGRAAPAPRTPLANYGAAGALVSTAADLSRFAAALLGDRLLSKPARETLFADGFSVWPYAFADPAVSAPVAAVERQGSVGAYRSSLVLLPERGGWLIVLANSDAEDYSTWLPESFTHRLLARLLAGITPSDALTAALAPKSIDAAPTAPH